MSGKKRYKLAGSERLQPPIVARKPAVHEEEVASRSSTTRRAVHNDMVAERHGEPTGRCCLSP
jgi:hypothetical protein